MALGATSNPRIPVTGKTSHAGGSPIVAPPRDKDYDRADSHAHDALKQRTHGEVAGGRCCSLAIIATIAICHAFPPGK